MQYMNNQIPLPETIAQTDENNTNAVNITRSFLTIQVSYFIERTFEGVEKLLV